MRPAGTAVWPVLLAGGDGTRLCALTRGAFGCEVPKQFCSLEGERSLLQLALARGRRFAPPQRTLAVLAAAHRRWWQPQLAGLPAANRIVEPSNRGTAPAVLLAAKTAARRDPHATLLLLPADHYVDDESRFGCAIGRAVEGARDDPARLYLIGIEAERDDPGFGWILPGAGEVARPVARFVEKPDLATVRRLRERGALVNTLVVAGSATAIIELFREHLPATFRTLGSDGELRLDEIFARLPCSDFSRDLLERVTVRLRVVAAERCGWNDLGTPERLAACLRARPRRRLRRRPPSSEAAPIELARAFHLDRCRSRHDSRSS